RGIDARLTKAIDAGQVSQVIEIAAGLSGRGLRMMQRYGDRLTYIETDLPAMVATKRRLLEDAGLLADGHRVVVLDALASSGAKSLAGIAKTLDPKRGTAIITEGLMNYLDPAAAHGVWRRIAKTLSRFPQGLYLADAYLQSDQRGASSRLFGKVIGSFVKGRLHVHFETREQGLKLLRSFGFKSAVLHKTRELPETREIARTPGAERVHVLEAWT
ncbi:MAG: class I SAM-dependent methyltransferase, partial [Stenotrophobium sp.]